jgi:hypothetical protein
MKSLFPLFVAIALPCSAAQVVFAPSFSEFAVTFPAAPKEQTISFTGIDGIDASALAAELATRDGFLKAEFVPISDPKVLDAMGDDEVRKRALEYARHNGLKVSHAVVDRKDGLRVVTVRGTKILTSEGREIAVTYLNKVYYGRRTMLTIYTGAPSASFPTESITRFLASIRKK